MRMRLAGFLGALLLAASAQATPIVTINGGTTPVELSAPGSYTITLGITPDAELVSGFNLILDFHTSIHLTSCTSSVGINNCQPNAPIISFGAALPTDQSQQFVVASFTFDYDGLQLGPLITMRSASTVTTGDPNYNDIFVGQVIATPEPLTASLLAIALSGLALLGRKRSA